MASDQLFRCLFIGIFVGMLSISGYRRYRARHSGEAISRTREGKLVLLTRLVLAACLYLPMFAYMLSPDWMHWSAMHLPTGLRWLGAAIGLATLPLLCWVFSSIGCNISETTLTKKQHVLVTHGPYRWVRHPLYSAATVALISLSLLATNWFMLAVACVGFVCIAVLVVPREETELRRKFGNEYEEYMQLTGRFFPRLFRENETPTC
jgi:protein-S-isoprenylcysteine O-methyltransferase Ste14